MERKNKAACFWSKILILALCVTMLCGGQLSAAETNGAPSILVGNQRETVSLDGEWDYFAEEAGGEIPEILPSDLLFSKTVSLPAYTAGGDAAERIWYRKTFTLVNDPAEAVLLAFGTDIGPAAVYVNNIKAEQNIAPLLHAGENSIVLLRQAPEDAAENLHFTDRIEMIFCKAPVIGSVTYEADPETGEVSFGIGLMNPINRDLTTDVSILLKDAEGNRKGSFVLEHIAVPAGGSVSATLSGIKIDNFTENSLWTAAKPTVYTAEIVTSGDRYELPFAVRKDPLFGSDGYRFGTDLIVSDFFADEQNQGYTWKTEWVTAFFKLIKSFNWTVITYRDGRLPEFWEEAALREGILLVDKNGDDGWAEKQDALWTAETALAAKAAELKQNDPNDSILPVLYGAAEGLYNDIPALSGVSAIRLKNIFSAGTQEDVKESRNIIEYFKEMFQKTFIREKRYKIFLEGLGNTLLIAVAATGFGVLIGMLIAIIKVWNHEQILAKKRNPILYGLNWLAEFYTTIIRGTPVVVQLLITYNIIFVFSDKAVLVGIFAFSINSGAYVSEIIRAGINSVDRGQTEAGRSLGLSQVTTMKSIVLPQAFKNILPALGNEFIAVLKETSVIGYLGVIDLTRAGELVRSRTADAYFTLISVALVYLILVFGLSTLFKRFERRLNKSDRN